MSPTRENELICEAMITLIQSTLFIFIEEFNKYGPDYEIVKNTYRKLENLRDIYNKHLVKAGYLFKNSLTVSDFNHYVLPKIRMPETVDRNIIYLDDHRRVK